MISRRDVLDLPASALLLVVLAAALDNPLAGLIGFCTDTSSSARSLI
jgi:hypothetical protein